MSLLNQRQLNFNDTFHFTYSSSSKPKVSNCLVNKSRLACVISIYLAFALVVKGRLLLTNSMLKLGLKNPLTVEFRTNLELCNQSKKGKVLKFDQKFQFRYIVP